MEEINVFISFMLGTGVVIVIHVITFIVWISRMGEKVSRLERVDEKVSNLEKSVAEIKGKLDPYVRRRSPISLTPKGEKLYDESGAKRYIEKNKDELIKV